MYNKVGWQNNPSTATPLNAENLNHMDNGIEQANRGIAFGGSATFDGNGVLKFFTDLTSIGTGSFATGDTDIVTVYIGCDVTTINGGAFANCPNLQTVYIDNTSDNITVSIPEGVNVVYNDDEDFINVNHFLAKSIKNIANRQIDKVKTAVDLNSKSITDTPVVNLSGCTVDNAPVTGAISGTVVNFNYKVDLENFIVQFLIMRNNYTYKRSYGSSGWSSWVLISDDLSKYLKTEDLKSEILSDTPSDTTTFSGNRINEMVGEVKRNKTALDVTINSGKVFDGVIGSTITIKTSQYWDYACIDVKPKSTIRVSTARNANTGIDGYVFFTDDNGVIISKEIPATNTQDYITVELTVPDNATKMYVRISGTYASKGIKAVLLETIDLQTQINSQQSRIDSQQEEVTTLNLRMGDPIKKETALEVITNSGKVFDGVIGSTITIKTSQYWDYACIDVKPKSTIRVSTARNANTGIDGYVFFTDDNGVIISKEIPATNTQDYITVELTVPDNATKMYVRISGTYASKGIKAVLLTDYPVYEKIADLENNIDEIENKIADPLPSYYTTEWLNNHYSAIREQAQVLHGISFAFVTDLHFPSNALNSKYLLKNILDNTTVPFVLCGGDFPGAYGTQENLLATMKQLIDYQNTIGKDRFFSTRGNHDFSIRTSSTENTGYTAPVAKTYNAIMRNSEFAISSIQAGKFYYYIDIPAQKTRIFMLCSCDTQSSETTPWGINYNVSQKQIDWLLEKMQEKDGWYYIFVSHIPADPAIGSYSSSQDELHNIMLALKNKTAYGNVDFSNSNNIAVCHITGHNHRNQSNVDNNFLSISTTCDAYYSDDGDGAKKGTLTEHAIDVFTIDYDSGIIQTHRVGRGSDRSWNY